MADCTFSQVCDNARGVYLNDVDVPGGEIFTNSFLQPHREQAYRELYNAMASVQVPDINRVIYWVLPAYDTMISPVGTIGLQDFNEPVFVEERGNVTVVAVSSTSTASPIQVTTATPHGLNTNQNVTVTGVSGTTAPWGRFFVTVTGATTFTLNGSISDGVAGTGGNVCYGTETFTEVQALLRTTDRQVGDRLYDYYWIDEALQFRGATTQRQLRITYRASGNPPTLINVPLGLDDGLTFLACRTAALAAGTKQWTPLYERLSTLACGPDMVPDGMNGLLRTFVNNSVVAMQRSQRFRRSFRERRNYVDWVLY